jgi:hypothetical protein
MMQHQHQQQHKHSSITINNTHVIAVQQHQHQSKAQQQQHDNIAISNHTLHSDPAASAGLARAKDYKQEKHNMTAI